MQKQSKKIQPLDKDLFYRWLHLHCFSHIYRIFTSKSPQSHFAYPRFSLFKQVLWQNAKESKHMIKVSLFIGCLLTFWKEVVVGSLITIFYACLNLLIPLMIKNFLHFMHEHNVDKEEISSTKVLIEGFIILQLLRIVFGQHSKRLFYELAIKVQSSLSLMIVKKSLKIVNQVRSRMDQSQILQLENIDLKLVFVMFQNMYLAIQAPITILMTIYLLYLENYKYGLIGIYWFVIAFLLQRELDQRMTHCNDTKLNLIEARSKVNYSIFGNIRTARLLGHQQLLIQKNNDYFIAQNHDHKIFYKYVTLYDISLLMLPIFVIMTITFYDINEPNPISVSQVYVMLSLLGICYLPMKSFRTLTINFHDGLRSIRRIEDFLKQPDEEKCQKLIVKVPKKNKSSKNSKKSSLNSKISQSSIDEIYLKTNSKPLSSKQPLLIISKKLIAHAAKQITHIKLHIDSEQELKFFTGQRLVVVGKVGSGIETLFDSLIGQANIQQGQIHVNDRIAYMNEQHFFRNTTVRENIRFFNKEITDQQIERVYSLLRLDEDLKLTQGLQSNIDDQYKFNTVQLHKIALARVLCSNKQIYLLDKVFQPLNASDEILLQQILRQKQYEGKLVILVNYPNTKFEKDDRVLILEKGKVKQFRTYEELHEQKNEDFRRFYGEISEKQQQNTQRQHTIFSKFGSKLSQKFNSFQQNCITKQTQSQKSQAIQSFGNCVLIYSLHLSKQYNQHTHKTLTNYSIRHYIMKFLSSISFSQLIYIFLIIGVAELMHIFIHFYIGHLEEQKGEDNYSKFRHVVVVEFVLTVGLAVIVWLEGEVASEIAVIQVKVITCTRMHLLRWDKINYHGLRNNTLSRLRIDSIMYLSHQLFSQDYQQVFIALHTFLNIYKNIVILIATIYFVSESKKQLILMTLVITAIYLTLYWILRSVERKVVNFFQQHKYYYVRVLEQAIGGAKLIQMHGATQQVVENAKLAYKKFASYKIAESYTAYGEEIFCDLVSLCIFTIVLNQGLKSKVSGNSKSIAQIATMIHLLIGMFDVLKNIVKEAVQFQTFFKINLLPFVEIIKEKSKQTEKLEQYIDRSILKFQEDLIKKSQKIIKPSSHNESKHKFNPSITEINNSQKQPSIRKITIFKKIPDSPTRIKRTSSIQKLISPYIKYDIQFRNVTLHESKYHEPVFEVYPLSIKINEGERVLFYQENDYLKNYLIFALTKNLPMFSNPQIMALERSIDEIRQKEKTILIGGRDICCIQKEELSNIVQVLIDHDFYIEGTLEDNIAWKNHNYDHEQVLALAEHLQFRRELSTIAKHGLQCIIKQPSKQLIKKISILRILSLKPKIIIIKDTQSIIQNFLLINELTKFLGPVTIIKISSNIDEAFDIDRIISTRNMMLQQDRMKQDAIVNPFSGVGEELRKANLAGIIYTNEMTVTLIAEKFGLGSQMSR